jgi:signal transduction histidine kinase
MALAAPVSLVALGELTRYAPADPLALGASLAAATVVVVAAAVAGPARPGWSDPAALSVERWLTRWPGAAGAGAMSWWVARVGGAGLLSALAFGAAGPGHGAATSALAAVVVVALVLVSLARFGRLLMPLALAAVAAAGALVTVGGTVALSRGRLKLGLLAPGFDGAPARPAAIAVHSATTVLLVCLVATCLLALRPAVSKVTGRPARWAISAAAGTSVATWGLAVPVLARAGGLSPAAVARLGSPRALTLALATVLRPLGGGDAMGVARGVILVTCLAGAFGAAGAAAAVGAKTIAVTRLARSPRPALPAAATALLAGAAALCGPRPWLVVALGALATGALALTALAPPSVGQRQRLPRPLRMGVALIGLLALGGSLAGAGAWALVAAGGLSVGAVFAAGPRRAGAALAAAFGPSHRQRAQQQERVAGTLAHKALPGLANALEALTAGEHPRLPLSELAELKAAVRPLEASLASLRGPGHRGGLSDALVDVSNQVARLAAAVETVARVDTNRLEELIGVRVGALAHANRNLVDSQWRRRQLLDRTVRVAEEERARIAANLHDGPIQRLAALGLVLDRCRLRMDRDDRDGARDLVKRARTELSEEIRSLRQLMSELRPPILDEGGLEAALRDHVSSWSSASGIEVRFEAASFGLLSPDSETVVYRLVQEALANVAKHSGAELTTVTLSPSGNGVQIVVRDDGKGFDAPSQPDLLRGGHFGLVVMRERVELASGRFEIHSAPRTGTEVVAWLPTIAAYRPVEVA